MCFTKGLAMLFSECDVLLARQRVSAAAPFFKSWHGNYFECFRGLCFCRVFVNVFSFWCVLGGVRREAIFDPFVIKNNLLALQKMSFLLAVFYLSFCCPREAGNLENQGKNEGPNFLLKNWFWAKNVPNMTPLGTSKTL